MKRKSFLLAIASVFGVRAAKKDEFNLQEPLVLPVPNGQCPVCCTQALPIVPSGTTKAYKEMFDKDWAQLQRCQVCSCAFWQDVEKEAK